MQATHLLLRARPRAFTLIEILLVVLILGGLLTITAPAIQGVVASSRLRDSASVIASELFEAQQLAITLGTETEVRFYQLPDPMDSDPAPLIRKLQVLTLSQPADGPQTGKSDGGVFVPTGSPASLGGGVMISSSSSLSSIVGLGFRTDKDDRIGRFVAVRFHTDGSTSLSPEKEWFLTVLERKASRSPVKPKNFVTLQIDAASGHVRSFQP
ncbi:MAG: Verru Chthon cassette protein [Verrucomicrobiaceae bacterium]|nr:Verru Chthon cassette protein [Verrucomicrobiaceae bacterium]